MKKTNIIAGMSAVLPALLIFIAACSSSDGSSDASGGGSGQGGSMARFTINGDYLYTVDDYNLNVVSIKDPAKPLKLADEGVGSGIETIFTMKDMLFIGSQGAMFIYDISNPKSPRKLSSRSHFTSCDPVVAYENLAFVTLNNSLGSWCGSRGDVLQIYDITDVTQPELVNEKNLSSPRGLAVDGSENLLFVCDKGVKMIDITAPRQSLEILYYSSEVPEVKNIDAYDCIAMNGTLLVIGSDGLYQLSYDREDGFKFISKIDLRQQTV